MNRSGFFLLIAAIFVAVLTIWVNSYWSQHIGFQLIQKDKKIDYYLSDFSLLNTKPDGKMRYLIKGTHLIHQQSTKASELYNPLIQASNANGDLTTLTAKKAKQDKKDGPISLLGKVKVVKNSSNPAEAVHFETQDLIYNPSDKTLTTDAKVILASDFGNLQGIGLSSKLDEQEIRILSNAQSQFIPATK